MSSESPEDLWKKWKDTGDDKYFDQLRTSFEPYAGRVASIYRKQGVRVPDPVIDKITQDVVIKALKQYDSEKGSLRGWMSSYLQKVKSTVAARQNFVRIPETYVYDIGRYRRAVNFLESQRKRVRTKDIAHHLGWPSDKVKKLEKMLNASTLHSAVPFATKTTTDPQEDLFKMIGPSLSKRDRDVYGLIRSGTTRTKAIAGQLGLSEPEVSRSKSNIFKSVHRAPGQ